MDEARRRQLENKGDQVRYLEARVANHRLLGQAVPAELQARLAQARAGRARMFTLLLAGGASMLLLFQLMRGRR